MKLEKKIQNPGKIHWLTWPMFYSYKMPLFGFNNQLQR